MGTKKKRRNGRILFGLSLVIPAVAATIGSLVGDTERIGSIWTLALLDAEGDADVYEVIDYDFGPQFKHGIYRDIPDLDTGAAIQVSSPDAPSDVFVSDFGGFTRIRIGDATATVVGRHRYRIRYPLDTVTVDGVVRWDGVGHQWTVPIGTVEVHLVAPFELENPACFRGEQLSTESCPVREIEPGHLVVETKDFDTSEGLTLQADVGSPLAARPALPDDPGGSADDPGVGWWRAAILAAAAAIVPAPLVWWLLRRRGREQVHRGGAADAAFGPSRGSAGFDLIDHADLDELATIEFESPRGLSASAGGIIHEEAVNADHQVAWLLECAIREEIVIDDSSGVTILTRGTALPHPHAAAELEEMFSGRDAVILGTYDKEFASAWSFLRRRLDDWRAHSTYGDREAGRRRTKVLALAILVIVVGAAAVGLAAAMANRTAGIWVGALAASAVVVGIGLAGSVRSWELLVRTPEGSARWLQVESFRRFIAGSEAKHVEAAASMGLLREYTAWAVALGEADHWNKAVNAAAQVPGSTTAGSDLRTLGFVSVASSIGSSVRTTSTAPSSSSSGGGGGGGGFSGGGGGGGGGGSW